MYMYQESTLALLLAALLVSVLEGIPTSLSPGSCVQAGFTTCCQDATLADCGAGEGTCFCDPLCFIGDDCCEDIEQVCRDGLAPEAPANVLASNITVHSAVIRWSVPYYIPSNETHLVQYKNVSTSNPLSQQSTLTVVLNNRTAEDCIESDSTAGRQFVYSAVLDGLEHGTAYGLFVVAKNPHGTAQSSHIVFQTLDEVVVQLKASPLLACGEWNGESVVEMKQFFRLAVQEACHCSSAQELDISGESLHCSQEGSMQQQYQPSAVYRATVRDSQHLNASLVLALLESWVAAGPKMTSGIATITFDPSCSVAVDRASSSTGDVDQEELCRTAPSPNTTTTTATTTVSDAPTTHHPSQGTTMSTTATISGSTEALTDPTTDVVSVSSLSCGGLCLDVYVVLGAMVAELLLLVTIVLVVVALVLVCPLLKRSKDSTQETKPRVNPNQYVVRTEVTGVQVQSTST